MKPLNLTDDREAFLDQLVEDLNSAIESYDTHTLSTEGSHAEYVESFGYGDGTPELDHLSGAAKALVALIPKGKRREALQACSSVESVNVFYQDNEVFRCMIGEAEHQIDGELSDRVNSLSVEEFEAFSRRIDSYVNARHKDLYYTSHDYEGFALILDEEKLEAWLTERGINVPEEGSAQ